SPEFPGSPSSLSRLSTSREFCPAAHAICGRFEQCESIRASVEPSKCDASSTAQWDRPRHAAQQQRLARISALLDSKRLHSALAPQRIFWIGRRSRAERARKSECCSEQGRRSAAALVVLRSITLWRERRSERIDRTQWRGLYESPVAQR